MRTWKRAPQLGSSISEFSRRYFFSLAIVALALVSSYYWASFPFDNLCETNIPVNEDLIGKWTIIFNQTDIGTDIDHIVVNADDISYKFCLQDFFRYFRYPNATAFPFVPRNQIKGREWMTKDQETITNIFGWSAVGVMFIIFMSFVWKWYLGVMELFRGTYEPCGDDMGINFSDVPSINSYIPQINSPVFSYPLLACNIDNIDKDLLDWTDPDRSHSYYDLTRDAAVLLRGQEFGKNIVFSQVAHFPPPGKGKKKPAMP